MTTDPNRPIQHRQPERRGGKTITDVNDEIIGLRDEFRAHIDAETVLFAKFEMMMGAHGSIEMIPVRVAYITQMMARHELWEKDRAQLRKAIIEKTVAGVIWAVAVYLVIAVGHDLKDLIRAWQEKGG